MKKKKLTPKEERLKKDYQTLGETINNKCPDDNHIIFEHFHELLKNYPNQTYVRYEISKKLSDKISENEKQIVRLQNDIDFYLETQEKILNNQQYVEQISKGEKERFYAIDIDDNNCEIDNLKNKNKEIKKWQKILKIAENTPKMPKISDEDFNIIIKEFFDIYETITNLKAPYDYKATILVDSFGKADLLDALSKELSKQLGLCVEYDTQEYYINSGDGRFIPYSYNPTLMANIRENTIFEKPNGTQKKGSILNSVDLFDELPKWVHMSRTKNQNLVGFTNCFYNIKDKKKQNKEVNIPLLPLRNTKTQLYLDEKIDGGAMERIFKECFTEVDAKILLAYIGCCLYDKGYTQRQESIFLLSLGGLGKSTFVKALCEIFYSWQSQIVTKLSDEKFGLSMFGDNDCIIIDEIQGANKDFVEILKIISTGSNLAVEKKNKNTINIPAEVVPRCWFIGNQFPKEIYKEAGGEGVLRRILTVVPKKSIKDLGYRWQDLITDECKQWLVQQATKEYIELGLINESTPIPLISNEEKLRRITLCTFPERCYIKQHFEPVYKEGTLDISYARLPISQIQSFIYDKIREDMIETTIRKDNQQTFMIEFKEALKLPSDYHSERYENDLYVHGVVPKTKEAQEAIDKFKSENTKLTMMNKEEKENENKKINQLFKKDEKQEEINEREEKFGEKLHYSKEDMEK